jgi:small subunit ribosomal protein S21
VTIKSAPKRGLSVEVRNNNVDKAIRLLNRKVKQEGIIRELRAKQFYEKPSAARRRKHAEAVRRVNRQKRIDAAAGK